MPMVKPIAPWLMLRVDVAQAALASMACNIVAAFPIAFVVDGKRGEKVKFVARPGTRHAVLDTTF